MLDRCNSAGRVNRYSKDIAMPAVNMLTMFSKAKLDPEAKAGQKTLGIAVTNQCIGAVVKSRS